MFNFKTLLFFAVSAAASCTPDFGILSDSKAFRLSVEGLTAGFNATAAATTGLANAPIVAFPGTVNVTSNGTTWLAAGTGATSDSNPFRICVPGQESFCITGNMELEERATASAQQLFWIECEACDAIAGNGCQVTYVGSDDNTGLCLDMEFGRAVLADCAEIGFAKVLFA
ncbi:hypothetical protein B0H16DRAFT_1628024 [Mycena metata]|uniref:Cyanovirin-N domain-containing protein n=1 Tax=Mycena metata TaxID=1033252 RepID=A0AAD7H4W6_9AGAR|nr:hypothetical protein B0H16DRAFT_1628024 [Mycena metata]